MLALPLSKKGEGFMRVLCCALLLFSIHAAAVTGVEMEMENCEKILAVPRLSKAEIKIFHAMVSEKGVRRTVKFLSEDHGGGPIQTPIFRSSLIKLSKISKFLHLSSIVPGHLGLSLKRLEKLPPEGIFIQQPNLAHEALKHTEELERPYEILGKVLGEHSFFLLQDSVPEQHKKWELAHKLIMPHFQPRKIINEYLPKIRDIARDITTQLKHEMKTEITPGELSFYFAARVAADIFLNHKLTWAEARALRPTTDAIFARNKKSEDGGVKLHQFLIEKTNHADVPPLVKDLVRFQQENNLPDKWTADQLATLYFAAVETTQSLLGTSLYYLAKYPNWAGIVSREYRSFSDEEALSLNKTLGTRAFINENLRLHPPVPALQRTSNKEFILKGYRIPANTLVYIDILGIHRNPSIWGPNAMEFDPYRFTDTDKDGRLSAALIPFGDGIRVCIGQYLAMMEVAVFLGEVSSQFVLDIPLDQALPTNYGLGTMRVSDSLKVQISPK